MPLTDAFMQGFGLTNNTDLSDLKLRLMMQQAQNGVSAPTRPRNRFVEDLGRAAYVGVGGKIGDWPYKDDTLFEKLLLASADKNPELDAAKIANYQSQAEQRGRTAKPPVLPGVADTQRTLSTPEAVRTVAPVAPVSTPAGSFGQQPDAQFNPMANARMSSYSGVNFDAIKPQFMAEARRRGIDLRAAEELWQKKTAMARMGSQAPSADQSGTEYAKSVILANLQKRRQPIDAVVG